MKPTARNPAPFPFSIIRLWPHHHANATELAALLAALKRNRSACDEVWFATEIGFPPLASHARSAQVMAEAAKKIRALGIQPGLQIANTLGHGMSLLQDDSGAVWPRMVDQDGHQAPTAPCPRAPAALDYIARLTRLYAAWQPSSIWIDDDLRMNYHGAFKYGCFCPRCLQAFWEEHGQKHNRRSLVAALQRPSGGTLRLAWTKFNAKSLAGIATVVAKATHAVAPACRLAFQQIGHEQFQYSGPDWSPVLQALARHSRHPAGARLGHGYYTDHAPRGMINKAFLISRQVSRLPGCVDQICPEIEGFTHNAFGKSAHGLAVESSLDLAMGCNSLSYAILCSGHEPMAWYETLLSRIAAYRPFWKELVRINAGTHPGGLDVRLGLAHAARKVQPDEAPFAWSAVNLDSVYNLAFLGLPLCTSAESTGAAILHADAVAGLSDRELRRMLSGGVMMDGLAAMRIQERGLGKWLGVRVKPIAKPIPFREKISGDPLNGAYAGRQWNSNGNATGAFLLQPVSSRVRVLGHYEDRLDAQRGVATVLARNPVGGRVAVFGYFGWEGAPSGPKRHQYLAAADWIMRGKLPAVIQTTAQVMVVPRVNAKGRLVSVFLLNASIDATPPLTLRLRGVKARTARWLVPEEETTTLRLTSDRSDKLVPTPALAAWSVGCVAIPS